MDSRYIDKIRKVMGRSLTCMIIAGMLTALMPQMVQAQDSHWMNVKAVVNSPTMLRLSWKSKKVSYYKLYRCQKKKDSNYTKYKLIARLNKNAVYYTDKKVKKDQEYDYKLEGYKNGKKVYQGSRLIYTGLMCFFDEYQVPDANRSTEAVCLNIISYGMKPDGYEIYRRNAGNKKFTLLAVTKKSVSSMTYTDKKVTCAESYEYKVRSYKTIAKKRQTSKYSSIVKMSATNQIGKYWVQLVPEQTNTESEAVFMITSEAGNGEMTLNNNGSVQLKQNSENVNTTDETVVNVNLTEYSTDGINWNAVDTQKENYPVIKEKETLWIKVKSDGRKINSTDGQVQYKYYVDMIRYNDLTSRFEADLLQKTGKAFVFEEAYH